MKTARLTLRPVTSADAGRIAMLGGEWEVASMTGRIPYPYSEKAALHWVSDLADGEVVLGIEKDGHLIGICGFSLTSAGTAEIGYWIGKPYWGKGYATEASRMLMSYGFVRAGIKRFTCAHFFDNQASARVASKLGFRLLGHASGWCEARGMDLPTLRYERRRPMTAFVRSLASGHANPSKRDRLEIS